MVLTEKQVIAASGEYPQRSDEELLAETSRFGRRAAKRNAIALASLVLMFVMLGVMCICGDPDLSGFLGRSSAALGFIFLCTFGWFGFSAMEDDSLVSSFEHELGRRGIARK